ncbi:Ba157.4 [Baboon cytomegalovirus]|nr:Ba157.4 [Baboon cytomegalovirus]
MTPYCQFCVCILCLLLGMATALHLHLDKLCPAYSSPPQDFGLFESYDVESNTSHCGNESLYVLRTKFGQHLVERPSPWVNKLVTYLSGRKHSIFQNFTKVAASPQATVPEITKADSDAFRRYMKPKHNRTLLYKVKDGPDIHICQMRVTTTALTFPSYITFQVRIELIDPNRKFNSICIRPNLFVQEEPPVTTRPPRK